jgi:hypothetical protein
MGEPSSFEMTQRDPAIHFGLWTQVCFRRSILQGLITFCVRT